MPLRSLFLFLYFLPVALAAQEKKWKFGSQTQVGMIHGVNDTRLQLQTVNGVAYGTWFAGAGAGLDYYYFRTVPVFLSLRKNILDRNNTPYAYMDLGSNIPWVKEKNEMDYPGAPVYSYAPGLYYDAGVGYSASDRGKISICFSVGYSGKHVREKQVSQWAGWEPSIQRTEYILRRLSIRAGIRF